MSKEKPESNIIPFLGRKKPCESAIGKVQEFGSFLDRLKSKNDPYSAKNDTTQETSPLIVAVADLVYRKKSLQEIKKALNTKRFRDEYKIEKKTPSAAVEEIFKIQKKEVVEQEKMKVLEKFARFATFSEKLKFSSEKEKEDRGTEMGDPKYYETKASNKTWTTVSGIIQTFLKDKYITGESAIKECEKFIDLSNNKYDISSQKEYPSELTTEVQLNAIKRVLNTVMADLIQYGGENSIKTCKIILAKFYKQKELLNKILQCLPSDGSVTITDEQEEFLNKILQFSPSNNPIKTQRYIESIKEELENIEIPRKFIEEQLKIKQGKQIEAKEGIDEKD